MNIATFPRSEMTIGFLSPHNPYDRSAFGGTPYFAARALGDRPGVSLRILGEHRPRSYLDRWMRRPSPQLIDPDLDLDGLDAVVGLAAPRLLAGVQRMRPGLPTIHVSEATPAYLNEAYGWAIPGHAVQVERLVAAGAMDVLYSSWEMAARAGADLGLPDLKASAAPFGINLDDLPQVCPDKPMPRPLQLLFVGSDWERKGGDIAVAALDRLNQQGLEARLTIVGRCPERHRTHPAVTCAGFLDRGNDRAARELKRLYRAAHVLLVPSRADCAPMAIGEAMAHGTPVIATETGGIASLIGPARLLAPQASPQVWAAEIRKMVADRDAYAFLSDNCFEHARTTLSWDRWASRVAMLCQQGTLAEEKAA